MHEQQIHLYRTWNGDNIFHCPVCDVRDKWPKSKYQNLKSTQWFSYKIHSKNSKEPIVYLYNWPLPEQHHFFKIQWEIHFLTFLNTDRNAYLRIFSLTTSRSRKLILKLDLKWECPYFYSNFSFVKSFCPYSKKSKKWIFHCIFKKWFGRGRVFFFVQTRPPPLCVIKKT